MGRLTPIHVALLIGAYGVAFFGYSQMKGGGISFASIWLPSQSQNVAVTLAAYRKCQAAKSANTASYTGSSGAQSVATVQPSTAQVA